MLEDIIHNAIGSNIVCDFLDVSGDGKHFDAVIVTNEFVGKNLVARHRLVYKALGDRMKEEIHALSMKVYTPEEWSKLNG